MSPTFKGVLKAIDYPWLHQSPFTFHGLVIFTISDVTPIYALNL